MAFEADLEREFNAALEETKEEFSLKIALMSNKVVSRTPVKTGLARSNWFLTTASRRVSRRRIQDTTGGPSRENFLRVLKEWVLDPGYQPLVLYNNLPYIQRLENGYSTQAPEGFLAITAAEFDAGFI